MTSDTQTDRTALETLLQLEKNLLVRVEELNLSLSKSHSKDFSEQATERENDEVIESLKTEASEELNQVKIAIKRIHEGTYHNCSQCNKEIQHARLNIIPYSTLCINCAAIKEA